MDKNLKYSTGEMGNTAFADQLMGAVAKAGERKTLERAVEVPVKAGERTGAIVSTLPDLDKIEVAAIEIPQYDGDIAKAEAAEKKQYAEAAGSKLVQIRENLEKIRFQIRKIESDPNSALSATAKSLLIQLRAAEASEMAKEKQILGIKDEAVKAHVEFSALLDEIRVIDSAHIGEVREILSRVCKLGRYRFAIAEEINAAKKPEGRWPSGALFFEGKVYFSIVDASSKSNGQRALEAELRKLVDAAKMSKAATIKTRGNLDLSGFKPGRVGLYYFFNSKRTAPDGRKFSEGHALVEIRDNNKGKYDWEKGKKVFRSPFPVVEVKDGVGSLARFVSDRWVPHFWIDQNRIVPGKDKDGKPKRLPDEEFKRTLDLIHTLRALYGMWNEGLNHEAAKPKEEKPEEQAETLSIDTPPMPAKFDRKIEAEAGEEIQVFKKTKKAKKAE